MPALVLLSLGVVCASYAQKAQPVRIPLSPGKSSTTVTGHLRGRQQMDYEAAAAPGQTLTLRLIAAPSHTVSLKLYSPEGAEMSLEKAGLNRWTAQLPNSGDYGISVLRTGGSGGISTYKLSVMIR